MAESHYSRFIVCDGSIDQPLGVVLAKEFLAARLLRPDAMLREYIREPLFVPATASALGTLELFRSARLHMAVVVDEHGSTVGLLTSNDILEAIIGDMVSTSSEHEPDAVRREDGSWLVSGAMRIDDFEEVFGLPVLSGENRGEFQTIAGFVLAELGRLPNVADSFEWGRMRFEIVDMDGKRIDKLLITIDENEGGERSGAADRE